MANTEIVTQEKKELREQDLSMAQRFSAAVTNKFRESYGELIEIPDTQKRLFMNYHLYVDRMLVELERKRASKNLANTDHKYDNNLPYRWNTIDFDTFVSDALFYSKLGLDPLMKNHLSFIPFADKSRGLYSMMPIEGYVGIKLKALKYSLVTPTATVVEVIYSNDIFTPLKADFETPYDRYKFEITQPFNRGKIIGAFGYHHYEEPKQNKLVFLSLEEIEKRSPHRNVEFWGGKKTIKKWDYSLNKKVEQVEEVTGWLKEMCEKCIYRIMFSEKNITLDPNKIDEAYIHTKHRDMQSTVVQAELDNKILNANKREAPMINVNDFDIDYQVLDEKKGKEATTFEDEIPFDVEENISAGLNDADIIFDPETGEIIM